MIRSAEHKDIPQIAVMGRRFFMASGFAEFIEFDPESLFVTLQNLIDLPHGYLAVAQVEDKVVGFVGGMMTAMYMNQEHLMATELFWWLDPKARGSGLGKRLLKSFEHWATESGASVIVMSSLDQLAPQKMAKFYRRMGYHPTENLFVKGLHCEYEAVGG